MPGTLSKVGNFVLPPPTSRFLRCLKAENFAALAAHVSSDPSAASTPPAIQAPVSVLQNQMKISLTCLVDTPEHNSTNAAAPLKASQPQLETAASDVTMMATAKQLSPSESERRKEVYRLSKRTMGSSTRQSNGDSDSQQGFVEIDLPTLLHDFDPSLCLSFEMLAPSDTGESRTNENKNFFALQPIPEKPNLNRSGPFISGKCSWLM